MANVLSHINGVESSRIRSVNTVQIANIDNVIGMEYNEPSASFGNANAVAKSITTGTGQSVRIADTNGKFNFIHSSAYTISFWVKAGWNSSLNTNIHLFSSTTSGTTNSSANMIRIFYHESYNRLYFEYRSASNAKKSNFYLFHANSGNHAAAYAAAGLGSSQYWSSANRGNANSAGYTMITVTKGTSNSAGSSNAPMYWNATPLGNGHYGSNGTGQGTPNMSTADRQIAIGSNSWSYAKSGNSAETKYNDVTVWNKKLSQSEITELYNSGTPLDATAHSAASSLKMYYKMENNGVDSSGNSAPNIVLSGNSNFESK